MGNLSEEPVHSAEEALLLIRKGEEWRHVGETNLNEKSSRSHTIVRLVLLNYFASFPSLLVD